MRWSNSSTIYHTVGISNAEYTFFVEGEQKYIHSLMIRVLEKARLFHSKFSGNILSTFAVKSAIRAFTNIKADAFQRFIRTREWPNVYVADHSFRTFLFTSCNMETYLNYYYLSSTLCLFIDESYIAIDRKQKTSPESIQFRAH